MATATSSPPGRSRRRLQKEKPAQEPRFLTPFESVSLELSGFFFRDEFLGAQASSLIRGEVSRIVSRGALRPAGVGRDARTDTTIRGDHLCWMERAEAGPGLRQLMTAFEALRKSINRNFYLGLDRFEMQLAQYPAGSQGYRRHLDAFRGKNERNRRLTAIYYLNPGWRPGKGGELAVYLGDAELQLEPIADRLVVFFAEQVEHAVLPTNAPRLALTAWFHAP